MKLYLGLIRREYKITKTTATNYGEDTALSDYVTTFDRMFI